MSYSPDGQTLASGSRDETVRLWEVASGQEKATLQGHTNWVTSVSFSPDGQTLASGSRDETVRLWEVASGQEKATLEGHTKWVTSVSFSPDGQTLASGSWDNTVRLWDVASGQTRATLEGHTGGGGHFGVFFAGWSDPGQRWFGRNGAVVGMWPAGSQGPPSKAIRGG